MSTCQRGSIRLACTVRDECPTVAVKNRVVAQPTRLEPQRAHLMLKAWRIPGEPWPSSHSRSLRLVLVSVENKQLWQQSKQSLSFFHGLLPSMAATRSAVHIQGSVSPRQLGRLGQSRDMCTGQPHIDGPSLRLSSQVTLACVKLIIQTKHHKWTSKKSPKCSKKTPQRSTTGGQR